MIVSLNLTYTSQFLSIIVGSEFLLSRSSIVLPSCSSLLWSTQTLMFALASQEVHDISVAIGVDPVNSNIEELRYHKICILADADSDGLHIATLICALFLRHFRARKIH